MICPRSQGSPVKSPHPYPWDLSPTGPPLCGKEPDLMLGPRLRGVLTPRPGRGQCGTDVTKSPRNCPAGPDCMARLGEGTGVQTSLPCPPPWPSPLTSFVSTELLPRNLSFQSLDSNFSMAGTTRRHQRIRTQCPNIPLPQPRAPHPRPLPLTRTDILPSFKFRLKSSFSWLPEAASEPPGLLGSGDPLLSGELQFYRAH